MESELSELDDWVGTLAELQLGLERKCSLSSPLISKPSRVLRYASESPSCDKTHFTPRDHPDLTLPPTLPPRRRPAMNDYASPKSAHPGVPHRGNNLSDPLYIDSRLLPFSNCQNTNLEQSLRATCKPLCCGEANAEHDLNSLLRQLQEVEQTLHALEQDDGDFTRRYSLASSSTTDHNTDCNPSPTPDAPEVIPIQDCSGISSPRTYLSTEVTDFVTSPANQSPLKLMTRMNGFSSLAYQIDASLPMQFNAGIPCSNEAKSLQPLIGSTQNGDYRFTSRIYQNQPTFDNFSKYFTPEGSYTQTPCESVLSASSDPISNRGPTSSLEQDERVFFSCNVNSQNQDDPLNSFTGNGSRFQYSPMNHYRKSSDHSVAETSALSFHLDRFPSQVSCDGPASAFSAFSTQTHTSEGQSISQSIDGSLSDKSMADIPEASNKLCEVVDVADRLQSNKLVVRVFQTDKTTKAILIDQDMTAGEVASLLIEKNFMLPSQHLCLVEKVPTLKAERIFEESENVAKCILSWPSRSQNMIFFEKREDIYGFIESPSIWLGKNFSEVRGFDSSASILNMLETIDCSGLPEWNDFLYIRKPGEKTWARRLCVLRKSGLYTTKKNKKSYNASSLIRLLVLDDKIHIYSTTGGWSRMRAPTPHGFALKTYAAQDFNSTHVFCFCTSDEAALRHWMTYLRIAKYGKILACNYRQALLRITADSQSNLPAVCKTLMRKSSLEVNRLANQNHSTMQQLTHRQASTGNLNFSSIIKYNADLQGPDYTNFSTGESRSPAPSRNILQIDCKRPTAK